MAAPDDKEGIRGFQFASPDAGKPAHPFGGTFTGDGAALTNVDAAYQVGLTASSFTPANWHKQ